MTAATTTPLQTKFGPIVADAAGTITVQQASDVLDCSRLRIREVLTTSAGRVPITDVLALKSPVPPTTLKAAPAAKLVRGTCADAWLPRPRAAQPNLNPSDSTPIPTEYKRSRDPDSDTLRRRLTLSLAPASGTAA
jgi:hypothetical protein